MRRRNPKGYGIERRARSDPHHSWREPESAGAVGGEGGHLDGEPAEIAVNQPEGGAASMGQIARIARYFTIALAGAQTAYWVYTFRLIAVNATPIGDGMAFAALVPFGLIFFALVALSLLFGMRRRLPLGAALAIVA
jgi:hypothetical protein